MKKLLLLLLVGMPLYGQSAGNYLVSTYGSYSERITAGNGSTGPGSVITVPSAQVTLFGGVTIVPFAVGVPVLVDIGPTQETVVITGTNGCYLGAAPYTCQLTANFTQIHPIGAVIASGTYGLQEAINSAFTAGGGQVVIDSTWLGQTSMITGANGSALVGIIDQRVGAGTQYSWNGAAYAVVSSGGGGGTTFTPSLPLSMTGTILSLSQASAVTSGFVSATDYARFSASVTTANNASLAAANAASVAASAQALATTANANANSALSQIALLPPPSGTYLTGVVKNVTTTNALAGAATIAVTDGNGGVTDSGTPLSSIVPFVPPTGASNLLCATNATPGGATQACVLRKQVVQDIPQAVLQYVDNAVEGASYDGTGHPNYFASSGGLGVTFNGATVTVTIGPNGQQCSLTSNLTVSVPSNAGDEYLFASCGADGNTFTAFATETVPQVSHQDLTPACVATSGQPQYWFNLDTNLWQVCTVAGGAFSVASPQVVAMGDFIGGATSVTAVAPMPLAVTPSDQFNLSDATSGSNVPTSGTVFIDGFAQYSSAQFSGTSITTNHPPSATMASTGLLFASQWPVMITDTATLTTIGTCGGTTASATTGTGSTPIAGWFGAGGGIGSAGTTSAARQGGGHAVYSDPWTNANGATTTTAALGASTGWVTGAKPPIDGIWQGCSGAGSAGTGDGTNSGGVGGAPSSPIFIRAPGVFIGPSAVVTAAGQVGAVCTTGNTGSGGSSGGALAEFNVGYLLNSGTISVAGGAAPATLACGSAVASAHAQGGNGFTWVQHAF